MAANAGYFEIPLGSLKAEKILPFSVFLYFSKNDHLMTWLKDGETPSQGLLERFRQRGLASVWLRVEDTKAYEDYLAAQGGSSADEEAFIRGVPSELSVDTVISGGAAEALHETWIAGSYEHEDSSLRESRRMIDAVVEPLLARRSKTGSDVWKMASLNPDLSHSTSVATLAAIFSLSLGRADPLFVTDLVIAGLLHDLGLCKIRRDLAQIPWSRMTDAERSEYATHSSATLSFVDRWAGEVPERAREILVALHAPQRMPQTQTRGAALILAFADLVESLRSGTVDGERRRFKQAFELVLEDTPWVAKAVANHFGGFDPAILRKLASTLAGVGASAQSVAWAEKLVDDSGGLYIK